MTTPVVIPPFGAKVFVEQEKRPYVVRARNSDFAVCTKPFNLRHTVLYCILDRRRKWRGPENLIFGFGAETNAQCEAMLSRLTTGQTEVSRRYYVPWDVVRWEL